MNYNGETVNWLWLICLLTRLTPCSPHNILLLTRNNLDHLGQFLGLGQALMKLGHRVTVIANDRDPEIGHLFTNSGVKFMYHRYPSGPRSEPFEYLYSDEKFEATYVEQVLKRELTEECMKVVYSDELFERIRVNKYDLAIVDSTIFCYHLIPYRLKIPFVSMGSPVYPFLMRMHPLLSVEPCLMKTEDSFMNRIYRLVNGIYGEISPKLLIDESQFAHAVPENLFYSLREVAANSSLWLVVRDPVLDCPLPTSPGVIQIGSLLPIINTTLPADIQKFVTSNQRLIVVIWFSHSLRNLTERIQDKFYAEIRRSGMLYLWYRDKATISDNARTLVNTSLDTLLTLPRIKLLITDCSTAVVSKAIYYSVPLLCMPVFGEHRYNAYRVLAQNIGLYLDIRKFRGQDIGRKLKTIIRGKYGENIRRLSLIQRALPDSRSEAAFWIDHVMKYGWKHLRTSATKQPLYMYLMADIYLFAVALMIMLAYLVKYSVKILLRTNLAKQVRDKYDKIRVWYIKSRSEEKDPEDDEEEESDDSMESSRSRCSRQRTHRTHKHRQKSD